MPDKAKHDGSDLLRVRLGSHEVATRRNSCLDLLCCLGNAGWPKAASYLNPIVEIADSDEEITQEIPAELEESMLACLIGHFN